MPLKDFRGSLLGGFSGSSFVATYLAGDRSAVVRWRSLESAPELVTPIGGAVIGMAISPDERRLAMAVAQPKVTGRIASNDPATLLLIDLETMSGLRLVAPDAGARFGADVGHPILAWSADGEWLALGGMEVAGRAKVCTYVVRLREGGEPSVQLVDGRPAQWREGKLLLARGRDAFVAWSPTTGNEHEWDGTGEWLSPDQTCSVRLTNAGEGTVVSGGVAMPFSKLGLEAGQGLDWVGPHHAMLAGIPARRGYDLSLPGECAVLPEDAPPGVLAALSRDSTRAVFRAGDSYLWAIGAGEEPE